MLWALPALGAAQTAPATLLGQTSDWHAHKYYEQTAQGTRLPVCVLSSRAILSQPKSLNNRKPTAYISKRAKSSNKKEWYYEVAIHINRALLPDRAPQLQIGERTFSLFAGATRSNREAEWAWVHRADIRAVFALMRAGSDMALASIIENERQVRDRFSLFGISKGLGLIEEHCARAEKFNGGIK